MTESKKGVVINIWGAEPKDISQADADLVAKALGLEGADRYGCPHKPLGLAWNRLSFTRERWSGDALLFIQTSDEGIQRFIAIVKKNHNSYTTKENAP